MLATLQGMMGLAPQLLEANVTAVCGAAAGVFGFDQSVCKQIEAELPKLRAQPREYCTSMLTALFRCALRGCAGLRRG